MRHFAKLPNVKLLLAEHSELELINQKAVEDYLSYHKPDIVIVAAGKVGGILANSKYPADFIYQNLMIETNLIHGAWKAGVKKLLNFGSSCMYPKKSPQPMTPDLLMTGKIEETNEPYAIAKLAGLSLCVSYNRAYGTSYITAIPSNVYGPGDSFDLAKAHVVASLIYRFHKAKEAGLEEVVLWGSGEVKRDFLFVDDLAPACEMLLQKYERDEPMNVGVGRSTTVHELAATVATVVGFRGDISWDTSKPDGAPERFLETSVIRRLGWIPRIELKEGLMKTYQWFLKNQTGVIKV